MNPFPPRRTRRTPSAAIAAIAATLGLAATAPPAFAWGQEGHRIVATLAYARLSPVVRAKVDALLATDADPLTAPDFASRATWADLYRDSDRKTTHVRYDRTSQWHYVDIEIGVDSIAAACFNHPPLPPGTAASVGPAQACVVDKIDQFAAELRDPATAPAERLLALKFVMHFVGDLHQPLHSADHDDHGGNTVRVIYDALPVASNLHSYWDTRLVEKLGKDAATVAVTLGRQVSEQQVREWSTGTASDWADEAFAAARDVVYDFSGQSRDTDSNQVPAERLSATYDERALPVVRLQLSRAGVRLAAVLNAALR